ncbi:MAG: hypothetical protein RLZZ187_3556, partial [Pseudomonadota bacterium]
MTASRFALAALVMTAAAVVQLRPASAQTLQEALALAYSNNPALQAARAQLRAVDENVPQALAGWRPTVQLGGSVGAVDAETQSRRGTPARTNRDPT